MKNILLLFLTLLFTGSTIYGQSKIKKAARHNQPQPMVKNVLESQNLQHPDFDKVSQQPFEMPYATARTQGTQEIIGTTLYDLQTNGSNQSRLWRYADGTMSATWIMSKTQTAGNPDRGTGYVHHDGAGWGNDPLERLESLRCGWPGITSNDDKEEYILSHATATNPYSLNAMNGPAGGASWTETNLPFSTPTGILWPRSAAGGTDGNTIHAIALTTPTAFAGNGGAIYDGMDGKLLYYRSLDGGANWDISDAELPGLDKDFYGGIGADSYSVTANGNTVVVALFEPWGDVAVWRSDSNGDNGSWTKTIVNDFPMDGYVIDDLYTFDDIGADYDSLSYPDSLAIFSTDGSGAILIDNNGMVHLSYGEMFILDDVGTDGNSSYFPGTLGLGYWNESLGEDGAISLDDLAGNAVDQNLNDTIDDPTGATGIAAYFNSLTSYPTMAVDDDNTIYLLFSSIREDNIDEMDQQYYRHIFVSKSLDGGLTWGDPFDIINNDTQIFPELVTMTEAVYPYAWPRVVDNTIHLIFQTDFRAGLISIGDMDLAEQTNIAYLALDTNYDQIINTKEPYQSDWKVSVFPNPTSDLVTVDLSQIEKPSTISVWTMAGQLLTQYTNQQGQVELNLSSLANGMYLLQVQNEDGFTNEKLLMAK